MLAAVGAASVDEFYADVPADLRLDRPLDLPAPFVAEQDLVRHVEGLLAKNVSTRQRLSFLGAGTYHHYVPAVVDEVINRSEFLTAYAGEPYEDHGRFQALFQYQSLMAELLAMDVVNVPTYDGYQATATALCDGRAHDRDAAASSSRATCCPRSSRRCATSCACTSTSSSCRRSTASRMSRRSPRGSVTTSPRSGSRPRAATGARRDPAARRSPTWPTRSARVLVVGTDPIGYGVLTPPAEQGADIVCGDIQSLGLHQWFGGAHGGFIAVHDDPSFIMEMPSRLFGLATTDVPGEYGFGDVAYDRTSFALARRARSGSARPQRSGASPPASTSRSWDRRAWRPRRDCCSPAPATRSSGSPRSPASRSATPPLHLREFTIDLSGAGLTAAGRRRCAPRAGHRARRRRSASTGCSSASPR